jgi:hypothetical protein
MTAIPFALTFVEGSLIFLGVVVITIGILALGLYSRRGSGINEHPYGDIDHSSGPETPSESTDVIEDVRDWSRGTAGHHHRSRNPPSEQ